MNIILPPGSTSAELQAAVDTAGSGDMIIISGDMSFTGTVTIPTGKEIIIQSNEGNNWVMSSPGTMIRHFMVRGNLVLQNIVLDGENIGGGVNPQQNSSFTMNSGSIIQNCFTTNSGGGVYVFFSSFTMNSGSVIRNCSVSFPTNDVDGGGVCLTNSTFTMNDGSTIENCVANGSGGGVFASGTGVYNMTGGTISGNRAGRHGGGVATANDVVLNMDSVTISGNTASLRGGGVYVLARSSLNITGESHIVNNSAQNGGGIYTMDTNYANLSTGADTGFSGNTASTAFAPPVDAKTRYPDIQFTSTSITDHPLNNYDINYIGAQPLTYQVTYDANSGTGGYTGPNIAPGGTDTVLSPDETGISRPDYTFDGWNTESDRSGASYAPGDTITITGNVTLYAQWVTVGEEYTVTYNANGGTGAYTSTGIPFANIYIVLTSDATGISRTDYTFDGWNTEPDGGGASYSPGDTITITENVTLYAQWVAAERFTITYGANGGRGSFEDSGRQFGTRYTILTPSQAEISRPGFTFTGWNTKPDGSGTSFAPGDIITISGDMTLYAQWRQNPAPKPKRICPKPVMKCRTAIEGQKIWHDNDNAKDTRPDNVEILLLRDGEVYKRAIVDSENEWAYGFCCLPVYKNSGNKYIYRIDEVDVPGYTKTIEGYNVINTLTP